MNMDEVIIFSNLSIWRGFARNKILTRVSFEQHSPKAAHRDYFEGSRVYSLEMLKQLQILFWLNVSL